MTKRSVEAQRPRPQDRGEDPWMVAAMMNVMNMVIHHVHDHDDA